MTPTMRTLMAGALANPEGSFSFLLDHRPTKYVVRDLEEAAEELKLPCRGWKHMRKFKIAGRYVLWCLPTEVERVLCGRVLSFATISKHTSLTSFNESYIRSRLRGEGAQLIR